MKLMKFDQKRCWECGKMCFDGAIYIGDENPDVSTRILCFDCIIKIYSLIPKSEK